MMGHVVRPNFLLRFIVTACGLIILFLIYGKSLSDEIQVASSSVKPHAKVNISNSTCSELALVISKVGTLLQSPLSQETTKEWAPPILQCDQLIRALASWSQETTLSLYRLAQLLTRLEAGEEQHIKILVLGGSMTAGRDAGRLDGAWPRKLEIVLQEIWGPNSVTVTNIAVGGWKGHTWLTHFQTISAMGQFDVIIGEFAVNDQADYDERDAKAMDVNMTHHQLLNLLVHLPYDPTVLLIELFRTAYTNAKDASFHCKNYSQHVGTQWICPQWWMPQTWREQAVRFNSIATVSYRDAVWPHHDEPPTDIGFYWDGMSHPLVNAHIFVAEALAFGFLVARQNIDSLLNVDKGNVVVPVLPIPDDLCLDPATVFSTRVGNDSTFPGWSNRPNCWQYRADSRDKFGWVAQASKNNTLCSAADSHPILFQTNITVGEQGKVIISYLESYDERMASARVWFVGGNNTTQSSSHSISSWHKERTSIEATALLHTQHRNNVTMNVELLRGTSRASKRDSKNGEDKFKLLGVITC